MERFPPYPVYQKVGLVVRINVLHRYFGLSLAVFWVLQALSGVIIQFRPEIDDPSVGPIEQVDIAGLEQRLLALEAGGDRIHSMWTTGGISGQFDIYLDRSGSERTVRISGKGDILRDRPDTVLMSEGAFFETLIDFHQTLLLGRLGEIIVGITGLFLAVTIGLGLAAGWPKRHLLRTLFAAPVPTLRARVYAWHRRIGFALFVPALFFSLTGFLLVHKDWIEERSGWVLETPVVLTNEGERAEWIKPAPALNNALDLYPGASLTALYFPKDEAPWYRIRLRNVSEIQRQYGATTVYVSAISGDILRNHDAAESGMGRRFIESLYPLHTGQAGGMAGRLLSALFGVWVLVMACLGISMSVARKR